MMPTNDALGSSLTCVRTAAVCRSAAAVRHPDPVLQPRAQLRAVVRGAGRAGARRGHQGAGHRELDLADLHRGPDLDARVQEDLQTQGGQRQHQPSRTLIYMSSIILRLIIIKMKALRACSHDNKFVNQNPSQGP